MFNKSNISFAQGGYQFKFLRKGYDYDIYATQASNTDLDFDKLGEAFEAGMMYRIGDMRFSDRKVSLN